MRGRLWAAIAAGLALGLLAIAIVPLLLGGESAVERRERLATEQAAAVRVAADVDQASLLAARAIADFGVGADVRLVTVRIVDELHLDVRIETTREIHLAEPIQACLVGPNAAPDDAGMEDRCWGDRQFEAAVTAALPVGPDGVVRLAPGAPVELAVAAGRGTERCDYPAGTWRLEVRVDPLIEGSSAGSRYVPDTSFEVPWQASTPLRRTDERRYCGLASSVYREQGEPPLLGD